MPSFAFLTFAFFLPVAIFTSHPPELKTQVGKKLEHVFIDAKHDRDDEGEVQAFNAGVKKLSDSLNTNAGFKTDAMKEAEVSLKFERQLRIKSEDERAETPKRKLPWHYLPPGEHTAQQTQLKTSSRFKVQCSWF